MHFSLSEGSRYKDESIEVVMGAVLDLFQGVGSDLNLESEDPSDPAFVQYLRDVLSWSNVPKDMREHLIEWTQCGCPKAW